MRVHNDPDGGALTLRAFARMVLTAQCLAAHRLALPFVSAHVEQYPECTGFLRMRVPNGYTILSDHVDEAMARRVAQGIAHTISKMNKCHFFLVDGQSNTDDFFFNKKGHALAYRPHRSGGWRPASLRQSFAAHHQTSRPANAWTPFRER